MERKLIGEINTTLAKMRCYSNGLVVFNTGYGWRKMVRLAPEDVHHYYQTLTEQENDFQTRYPKTKEFLRILERSVRSLRKRNIIYIIIRDFEGDAEAVWDSIQAMNPDYQLKLDRTVVEHLCEQYRTI